MEKKKNINATTIILILSIILVLFFFWQYILAPNIDGAIIGIKPKCAPPLFTDNFTKQGTLEESGDMSSSKSPCWWVNSGAYLMNKGGVALTVQEELPTNSKWRIKYLNYNPDSTDNGYHPQNIFRLVTKSKWENFVQQSYFKINKYHLSKSIHRAEHNGILLFNRYLDGDNLYYAGLRVDGALVIKKKTNGVYYTMAYKPYYNQTYDRTINPNLLPLNTWLGLRTQVKTQEDKSVTIKLFVDENKTGDWVLLLEATDISGLYGEEPIADAGYAGIRTDFMDVQFDDYQINGS